MDCVGRCKAVGLDNDKKPNKKMEKRDILLWLLLGIAAGYILRL